ncbi:MAG: phosphoribosyltransferase family protein [Candidatus Woesearchaeota archaeon]
MEESQRSRKLLSWDEFSRLMSDLAESIKQDPDSGRGYDSIICINRGGLVAGRMLSDMLGLPLGVVSAGYYSRGSQDAGEFVLDRKVSMTGSAGRRILLVDDIAGSGKTLLAVRQWLQEMYPDSTIHTAVMFQRPEKGFDVDYFARIEEDWIVFPYEANEFSS